MSIPLVVSGTILLCLCVAVIIRVVYSREGIDLVMIKAVLLVLGLLLSVALLAEGLTNELWNGWFTTWSG